MIAIESLLPNPVGSDSGAEWIKLANHSEGAVNLKGWTIKDLSGKTFSLSGVLGPQETLILKNSETKITLNNDTDTISLYNNSGMLADKLSYENPTEGEIVMPVAARASETSKPISTVIDSVGSVYPRGVDWSPLISGIGVALLMAVAAGFVAKYLSVYKNAEKL